MKRLSGLSLAARLSLGFGVILLLLVSLSALALVRMQSLSATLEEITVRNAARAQAINAMKHSVAQYVQTLGDLGSTDLEGGPAVLTKVRAAVDSYKAAQGNVQKLLPSDTVVAPLLQKIQASATAATELQSIGEKQAEGRGLAAQAFLIRGEYASNNATWSARQQAWGQAVDALSDWHEQVNAALSAQATSAAATARQAIMVGTLLAFALGCALAIWLVRDTRAAIGQAVSATQRMAQHDLSAPIRTDRLDEIGGLLAALEQMRLNLHALAAGVGTASADINNASGEIAQGSLDLSNRTEAAASTLQTTLGAISRLSAAVTQTTTDARSAQTLSAQASAIATQSGAQMAQVVNTMADISTASHKISDIIALIDGIAFQTNILALNAAVEAARAGEQGRGFAVVASEVRALAGRSAAAAKEIKSLIEASLSKVASGTAQVDQAGMTVHQVTAAVESVSATIASITREAADQLDHIEQTNQLVTQIDSVAQQNAALAEQSAAAASSLRQQATQLDELVHRFQLERSAGASLPVAAAVLLAR
ncbi:MAG: methyl-accepting chemotaxis protein [Rhodoferax sp.]|nr:methyl-accepting chemotaxis protein [Rhodoferax sp.]